MIEIVEKSEKEKQDAINRTEEEIRAKMAKQEAEIKAWQRRVESRNVVADRERQKRRQILDEVHIYFQTKNDQKLKTYVPKDLFTLCSIVFFFSYERNMVMRLIQTTPSLHQELKKRRKK